MDLFVYGTLQDDALVEALTGRRFPHRRATLRHYRRVELPGRYPWIEPADDRRVEGLLLEGLDDDAIARIDAYESVGSLYQRQEVSVVADDGERRCFTYVGIRDALIGFER